MDIAKKRIKVRKAKHKALRKKISGSSLRPRLSVKRTLKHIIVQVIDDSSGTSIVQLNSKNLDLKGNKTEVAKEVGKLIATQLKEKSIENILFDRAGYKFHGRVKAVADGVKENGIKI